MWPANWRSHATIIIEWTKNDLPRALRQFCAMDLRWSYLIIAGLVIVGLLINVLLAHGWTIWPFVLAIGLLVMVNEAADRNGEGIPPLHVYGFVASVMGVWVLLMIILSLIHPLILVLGISGVLYHCARAYARQREHDLIIATRRSEGRCIHCGEVADMQLRVCINCGNDPDESATQLQRVASMVQSARRSAHARAVLTPEAPTASVARKERIMLATRPRPLPPRNKK